jgi:hypothetical protein
MNRINSPNECPLPGYPSDQLTGTGQPPMQTHPMGRGRAERAADGFHNPLSGAARRSLRSRPTTEFLARLMRLPRHRAPLVPSSSADRLATAEDPRADTCAPASAAAAAAKPEMLPTTAHRHIMHARSIPTGLPACVHDPTVERHNDPSGRVSSQTSRIANPPRTAPRAFS